MALSKFQYADRVYSKSRQRHGKIVAPIPIGGKWHYRVDLGTESVVTLPEDDLEVVRTLLDRLADGDFGYASDFDLLSRATTLSFAYHYGGLSCLSNSRLDPKPYQIFVAHRALQDVHPRYLLADEVGLGKTIEAGLILKELEARGLGEKILIVVPASLRDQWRGEMAIKFNEQFQIYDGGTIRENLKRDPNANPWERDNQIITSLQYARQQTTEANQPTGRKRGHQVQSSRWIDEVDWDVVIFDEAHHLRRYLKGSTLNSGREITRSYRLGQALAERTKSLLLLTATPLQLSQYDTYSLIELLDPSLFPSFESFIEYMSAEGWQAIAQADQLLRQFGSGLATEAEVLAALSRPSVSDPRLSPILAALAGWSNTDDAFAVELIIHAYQKAGGGQKVSSKRLRESFASCLVEHRAEFHSWVEKQHKLSQIMIRNRKREVLKGEFVERRACKVEVKLDPEERELYDLVSAYIKSSYARITGPTRALGFVLTTFRKLLVSSSRAVAASLERRAMRIEDALQSAHELTKDLSEDELEERADTLESIEQLDDLFSLTGGLSSTEAQSEIGTLRDLAARARAISNDSKAVELLAAVKPILDSDSTEKVLVFTQFRETQTYLQELFKKEGYRVALFHGEDSSRTYRKRDEFERFKKDPKIRIMISTEVGGEGLNFQFCHVMFNYDLPWNPMRIEQRIGRLDRIGQTRDVLVYNFFLGDTIDARILTVLQDRIRLFEETIGNLDPILGENIERDIKTIMLADDTQAEAKLADFEELAERRIREARQAEEKMADFIMDARSFRRDTVDEILGRKPPISHQDIEAFTRSFLARYPHAGLLEPEGNQLLSITPPARFRQDCRELYGIHLWEKYRGTFDPKIAIREDTVDFFAFGHPLFDAVIRYCTDVNYHKRFRPKVARRVIHCPECAGYEGVQLNYVLTISGVRTIKKMVPVVLDRKGGYDQGLSRLILSQRSDEALEEALDLGLSRFDLVDLGEKSWAIMDEIAEQEIKDFSARNTNDFSAMEKRLTRIFDYRLRNQQAELEQRQARLQEAREKGQRRVIPAWEGQVRATQARIIELERQRDDQLIDLQEKQNVSLSIDLLNVAYVQVV